MPRNLKRVRRSRSLDGLKPDLYTLAQVEKLIGISDYKLNLLFRAGHFILKDIREPGAKKPRWRVTRKSYERYLNGLPSIESSADEAR